MGVGSLVLTALVLSFLGFATAVFDHRRKHRQPRPRTAPPGEAGTPAPATTSEPPG